MNPTENITCTISNPIGAASARCGAPAVSVWTNSRGETFAECADHASTVPPTAPASSIVAGSRVRVNHCGIVKTGTVLSARVTRATVVVSLRDGSTKNLNVALADLIVA